MFDAMPALHPDDLLTEAERIAASGPISPAGRAAYLGASAAVAGMPPAARRAAVRAALFRLADDEPKTALHALAAMARAETDAAIQAVDRRRWPALASPSRH